MKTHLLLTLALLLLPGLAACSDDDYNSRLPEIEDIVCVNQDGSTALRVGDTVTVTVKQARKGHLLEKTTYTWSCDNADIVFSPATETVAYDNKNANPVTCFTATAAGNLKLTFKAEYRPYGLVETGGSYTKDFANGGGSADYTISELKANITATKTIRIAQ